MLIVAILIGSSLARITITVNIGSSGEINSGVTNSLTLLSVEGQWIVNSNGNRTMLRGCATSFDNYGNSALISTEIQQLQETGCNCVRLSFSFTSGDVYDSTTMQSTVNAFGSAGIYCILDDIDNYGSSTSILPNSESTWISDWVGVSTTFKNNPYVAIYELMNEPYAATASQMEPCYISCINAIRANGDNHICMCFDGDFTSSSQLAGLTNVMFDEHDLSVGSAFNDDYGGGYSVSAHDWFPEFTDLNGTDQYISAEIYASEWVSDIIQYRSEFNVPDMMGEIEVYNYTMNTPDAYFNSLLIYLDEHYGISWNVWWLYGWLTDQYGSLGPNYWPTFCNQYLGGAFTSNFVSSNIPVNQTYSFPTVPLAYTPSSSYAYDTNNFPSFPAIPSNIWNNINIADSAFWCCNWGVTYIEITNQAITNVVFQGPCTLLIQDWSVAGPWYGTVGSDSHVTLTSSQTDSFTIGSNADVVVYAWANSPFVVPLINAG